MSLLHIMAAVRNRFRPSLRIEVIHFNHKLRDESIEEVSTSIAPYYHIVILKTISNYVFTFYVAHLNIHKHCIVSYTCATIINNRPNS